MPEINIPGGKQSQKDKEVYIDFLDLAEKFLKIQPIYFDNNKIWWLWNQEENRWYQADETDILNILDKKAYVRESFKSHIKSEILECIRRKSRLNKPIDIKKTWVQFKDKIVDIQTGEEFEVSPKYFAVNPIPHDIGETESTPIIDKIFEDWVGEQKKELLYEILAFSMASEYFIHRIFCLIGSGRNGKSKYLQLMRNFIGNHNITSTELDTLATNRFESAKLYKRLVCEMGETNFNKISKTSFLKKATGQDALGFEFKGKNPFTDINYAKFIIATNTLPVTMDKTDGYYRRWTLIDFPNQFSEECDILSYIPDEEYDNLARKCINILKRLWIRRSFTFEGSVEDKRNFYEQKSNPLNTFIKDKCIKDLNAYTPFWEFYDEYTAFLSSNGHRIQTKNEVGSLLNHDGWERKTMMFKRNGIETTQKCIVGLKLLNSIKEEVEVSLKVDEEFI